MTEERKIHYIDVGTMPKKEAIKMLDAIRNNVYEKRGITPSKETWFTRLVKFLAIWGAL